MIKICENRVVTVDCLFCRIVAGEVPAKKVFEDDEILAFHDVGPKAPVHILIIPKKHIRSLNESTDADTVLLGRLLRTAARLADELQVAGPGYRVAINTNDDGGQSVYHLHAHVMGKRKFLWPPG